MCGVTGMKTQMAEYIKAILMANPAPKASKFEQDRNPVQKLFPCTQAYVTPEIDDAQPQVDYECPSTFISNSHQHARDLLEARL